MRLIFSWLGMLTPWPDKSSRCDWSNTTLWQTEMLSQIRSRQSGSTQFEINIDRSDDKLYCDLAGHAPTTKVEMTRKRHMANNAPTDLEKGLVLPRPRFILAAG